MYRIKFNDDLIYMNGDKNSVAYDISLSLEQNKAGSLKFTIPRDNPIYIPKLKPFLYVYEENELIFRGRVISTESDFYENTIYVAEGMLAVLNDTLVSPNEYVGTVQGLFEFILDNHNRSIAVYTENENPVWQEDKWYVLQNGQYTLIVSRESFNEYKSSGETIFEISDNSKWIIAGNVSEDLDPNNYINRSWDNYTTSWELLQTRLLDEVGGFLNMRFEGDKCYLDYLTEEDVKIGSSQKVTLGENLMDFTSMIDATDLYTAVVPIGAEIKNRTFALWDYDEGDPNWQENKWYIGDGDKTLLEGTSGQAVFQQYINSHGNLYELQTEDATGTYIKITDEEDPDRNPPKYKGQEYLLATKSMLDTYGIVYAPISETTWDDVTLPANLLTKARNYLDNQAVMLLDTINIEFADLSKLGFDVDEIKLYSEVRVESAYHNIDAEYIVLEVSFNIDSPETSRIKIGKTELSLTDRSIKRDRDITIISGEIDVIRKDKADVERVEKEVTVINKTIVDTEESLGLRIQAVDQKADSIATRTTTLEQTADGICLEISRDSTDKGSVGWTTEKINTNFDFTSEGMEIGKSDSPTKMKLSNEDLTFTVNGVESATFKPNELDVRNVEVKNEVGFNGKWALRINPNGNLDHIWIGGN